MINILLCHPENTTRCIITVSKNRKKKSTSPKTIETLKKTDVENKILKGWINEVGILIRANDMNVSIQNESLEHIIFLFV